MNLSLFLSKKLSGSNSSTGRVGSVIAVTGVAIAIAVLEITMGVVIGFKHKITEKLEGFIAPLAVTAPTDYYGARTESFITLNDTLIAPVKRLFPEAEPVPVTTRPGIIKTDNDFAAIIVNGHEAGYPATFEKSNLIEGEWIGSADGTDDLVISRQISNRTGLKSGDKTTICFFVDNKIKARPFVVKGIYDSGFGDFDKLIAYTSSEVLRGVDKLDDNKITRLEVRNIPSEWSIEAAENLSALYDDAYSVSAIGREGAQYLNWLELLNTNVVVIFILMSLITTVTLISSLFILVLDKISTVGILRSLGSSDKLVKSIFLHLSLRLVGLGVIIGNVIGLGILLTQSRWGYLKLDPEAYYLDRVPVEISLWWLLAVNAGMLILAFAVILIPARFATRLSPISTIRYE